MLFIIVQIDCYFVSVFDFTLILLYVQMCVIYCFIANFEM